MLQLYQPVLSTFVALHPGSGGERKNWPAERWMELRNHLLAEGRVGHVFIVGGESGRKARPMLEQWAQRIRRDCQLVGVPFFFKQGSAANWPTYKDSSSFPESLRVREWPVAAV